MCPPLGHLQWSHGSAGSGLDPRTRRTLINSWLAARHACCPLSLPHQVIRPSESVSHYHLWWQDLSQWCLVVCPRYSNPELVITLYIIPEIHSLLMSKICIFQTSYTQQQQHICFIGSIVMAVVSRAYQMGGLCKGLELPRAGLLPAVLPRLVY